LAILDLGGTAVRRTDARGTRRTWAAAARAALATALALGLMASAAHAASLPQPIYFWASPADFIGVPKGTMSSNPRVIRPASILMFADGSWDLESLSWTGWGTSVARATGISSASNGIPDQATGTRIKSPVTVTLSQPGRFQGHEVYRCFTLKSPAHPESNERLCLKDQGHGYYLLASAPLTKPRPSVVDFFSGAPNRNVGCELRAAQGSTPARVVCESYGATVGQTVTMSAGGDVRICTQHGSAQNTCAQGDFGEGTPTYEVGRQVTVGPFRCRVERSGIRCVVTKTGKGFLIGKTTTTRVG
jgi:hypothetical protein